MFIAGFKVLNKWKQIWYGSWSYKTFIILYLHFNIFKIYVNCLLESVSLFELAAIGILFKLVIFLWVSK